MHTATQWETGNAHYEFDEGKDSHMRIAAAPMSSLLATKDGTMLRVVVYDDNRAEKPRLIGRGSGMIVARKVTSFLLPSCLPPPFSLLPSLFPTLIHITRSYTHSLLHTPSNIHSNRSRSHCTHPPFHAPSTIPSSPYSPLTHHLT